MKLKFPLLTLALIIITFITLSGCGSILSVVPTPDKITIYRNGKGTVIDKNNEKFNKIVEYTNSRFKSKNDISKTQLAINQNDFQSILNQKLVLEFTYLKETTLYDTFGYKDIKFNRLVFPLGGNEYTDLMFHDKGEFYLEGPLGPLAKSDKLIKLLE